MVGTVFVDIVVSAVVPIVLKLYDLLNSLYVYFVILPFLLILFIYIISSICIVLIICFGVTFLIGETIIGDKFISPFITILLI